MRGVPAHAGARQVRTLKVEALAGLGELLKQTPKAEGGRPRKTGTPSEPVSMPTLAEMGIDKKTSSLAQRLASLSDVSATPSPHGTRRSLGRF